MISIQEALCVDIRQAVDGGCEACGGCRKGGMGEDKESRGKILLSNKLNCGREVYGQVGQGTNDSQVSKQGWSLSLSSSHSHPPYFIAVHSLKRDNSGDKV